MDSIVQKIKLKGTYLYLEDSTTIEKEQDTKLSQFFKIVVTKQFWPEKNICCLQS